MVGEGQAAGASLAPDGPLAATLNGAMLGQPLRAQLAAPGDPAGVYLESVEVQDVQQWAQWKQVPRSEPAAPQPAMQAGDNEHLRSRLKVAEWQLRNSTASKEHPEQAREPPSEIGALGKEPPAPVPHAPNGAAQGHPKGVDMPNGVLTNGAGASPALGHVDSGTSQADTSPPSTQAEMSPSSHRGTELLLTEQTRRLASVRTIGVRAGPSSVEALQARLAEREQALAQAHVREAELQRETRVMAARLAQLRMAHEAQAGKLAEAAMRAVAGRSEVVRENALLSQQLAQAQNAQAAYAQQLLPLLAQYGLTPPASDPHAVTSNVLKLVDRLVAEINLLEKVVSAGGPAVQQRLAAVAHTNASLALAESSLPLPSAPQDVRGSADSALSLAIGIAPGPSTQAAPLAGPPLFPGGQWSPLQPGASTAQDTQEQPPALSAAEAARPQAEGVPERPMSVRFRPSPDAVGGAGAPERGGGPRLGQGAGSLSRRSPPWRPQDSAVAVRFTEEQSAGSSEDAAAEGGIESGPGRGPASRGPESLSLRDSQRNLLDSVASQSRGLGASQSQSMWQVSAPCSLLEADQYPVLAMAGLLTECVHVPSPLLSPKGWGDCPVVQTSSLAEPPDGDPDGGVGGEEAGEQAEAEEDGDPLPAIVNLKIAGEAVLGGKLTACGHSVYGSSLCYFQWVRHYQDGSAFYIEGAKQPEYLVSADDARCQITVECLPVDSRGRKGELVSAAANDGNPIPLDEITSNLLIGYQSSGKAKFNVLDAHNAQEHELVIDRRSFTIKRGKDVVIKEPYSADVQADIAVNDPSILLIHISQGRRMDLDCIDNRSRDLAVFTLRSFVEAHLQYLEEKNARKKGFFSRR